METLNQYLEYGVLGVLLVVLAGVFYGGKYVLDFIKTQITLTSLEREKHFGALQSLTEKTHAVQQEQIMALKSFESSLEKHNETNITGMKDIVNTNGKISKSLELSAQLSTIRHEVIMEGYKEILRNSQVVV